MDKKTETRGVFSQIYQSNSSNDDSSKIKAELLFLKRGSDAKLDIDPNAEIPQWLVPGAEVFLNIVWSSKGVVVFSGEITYLIGQRVHIGKLEFKETIQRRRDVKVHYVGEGTIYTKDKEKSFPVLFKDISASGAGFWLKNTPEILASIIPGSTCILAFYPSDNKLMELTSTVVRVREVPDTNTLDCGIAFQNLKPGVEMTLRQLVFQKQKDEIQRERDLKKAEIIEVDVFM